MTVLVPGANAPLPPAERLDVSVAYDRAHADVVTLLLDATGRADGDSGVALFSQPVCAGGAVRLEQDADRVTVELGSLPAAVERVLVVANADSAPTIDQTGGVTVTVAANGADAVSARFDTPPAHATVQLVELYRRGRTWKVRALGDGYAAGLQKLLQVHGIDASYDEPPAAAAPPEPSAPPPPPAADMRKAARVDLQKPDLPASGRVRLTKGEGVTLRKEGRKLTKVRMGLGWDPAERGKSIDLDASCVMLDARGGKVEAVSFMHLKSKDGSVVHTGDNLTGAGEGDDEVINVDLGLIPEEVVMLAFTVNSFSGQKFSDVANAFCRLCDGGGREQVRYDLTSETDTPLSGKHRGVVLATLERTGEEWTMTARGDLGDGRTYRGLMPIIKGYFGEASGGGGAVRGLRKRLKG